MIIWILTSTVAADAMEFGLVMLEGVDTIRNQHVQVDVVVDGGSEALNESDGTGSLSPS